MTSYLSFRCSVCETPTRSLALHSQSMDVPKCPQNWQELWIGYSFIMVSEDSRKQHKTCAKKKPVAKYTKLNPLSHFHFVLLGFHKTTRSATR